MIDQENPALNANIQHFGCYLMSILYLAAQFVKVPETAEEINQFYSDLLSNGHPDIRSDCLVEDPEAVFKALGLTVMQIKNLDGSVAISPVAKAPLPGFEILCYYWPAKNFTHFMAGDGHGNIAYDPIHRGSNTAMFGKLKSKRLFALVTK